MDNNYTINTSSSLSFNNRKSYKIDCSKIKTVEDCVFLIKCCVMAFNSGYEPDIQICEDSPMYEKMKHLVAETEN